MSTKSVNHPQKKADRHPHEWVVVISVEPSGLQTIRVRFTTSIESVSCIGADGAASLPVRMRALGAPRSEVTAPAWVDEMTSM
jgi:hypothetical protein